MSTAFDASEFVKGQWLHGSDLPAGQSIELTISGTRVHEFDDGNKRPVVEFLECEQDLSINKTQTATLIALFGTNTAAWVNQRIALTPVPTQFAGKPTIMITRAAPPSMPTFNGQAMAAAAPVQAAPLGVGAPGVMFRQPG
jgi:hypothetical protein